MNRHRVPPGSSVDLSAIDARGKGGFDGKKKDACPVFERTRARLAELQELLYAEGKHRVLVVLQATDTGGKDGTVRHVFRDVDPIGIKMVGFTQPTSAELARDFLWRVHSRVPGDGEMVLFNRSHYEDVLVVRVRGLAPADRVERRYRHIREFERMLADEGTTIVKFFLHISKEEQAARLQSRLDNPDKQWKFDISDIEDRKLWDDYQRAYERAIEETATEDAPWYIVPADRKWYRNLAIATILVDTLGGLNMSFPDPDPALGNIVIDPAP